MPLFGGDSDEKHNFHIVRWSEIALPKIQGGLGIRKLRPMNQACLSKLDWQIKSGKQTLWCNVMRRKYINQRQRTPDIKAKSIDTSLWKHLVKL